jgi:hypothetical protein
VRYPPVQAFFEKVTRAKTTQQYTIPKEFFVLGRQLSKGIIYGGGAMQEVLNKVSSVSLISFLPPRKIYRRMVFNARRGLHFLFNAPNVKVPSGVI